MEAETAAFERCVAANVENAWKWRPDNGIKLFVAAGVWRTSQALNHSLWAKPFGETMNANHYMGPNMLRARQLCS